MISRYLLPYILHPTRVTDHSETVIDNLFPITHLMKLQVEILSAKFLITFHSLLFLIMLLLITKPVRMLSVTFQILMNKNL